nr:DUF559 domain-containing protein [Methylibium sp.]
MVEFDGGQHYEPDVMTADAQRSAALRANGFHVMRFSNREALAERDDVLTAILDWLHLHHPHPSPLPPAGEGAKPNPLRSVAEGVHSSKD